MRLKNRLFYVAGIFMMALALLKNMLRGYATPNTVKAGDVEGRIDYAYDTVLSWLRFLPEGFAFADRDVLEVSPGSSLGTGAIILACGANSYHAIDIFELAAREPARFYSSLLDAFSQIDIPGSDVERAGRMTANGATPTFSYRVDQEFDITDMSGGRTFDVIVSCAAFEHYEDIGKTVADMSNVARRGCIVAHIIDFQTHSRWIRDSDPNNIYRYSDWIYKLFFFKGQPNRKRPIDYVKAFEANGWTNVRLIAATSVSKSLLPCAVSGLAHPFDGADQQMTVLSGVLIAEKA